MSNSTSCRFLSNPGMTYKSLALARFRPVKSDESTRHLAFRSIHHCSAVLGPQKSQNQSAGEKLFADAVHEETSEGGTSNLKRTRLGSPSQHSNWTGEESEQDLVLRMLVDKYKPLRSGPIRTADEKLRDSPPQVRQSTISASQPDVAAPPPTSPWQEMAGTPLLPSIEGHRPWHTTFKAPSHATASIKLGNFTTSPVRSSTRSDDSQESTIRTERELAKRKQQAHRLSHARESSLDYRLGLRGGGTRNRLTSSQTNPVSLKGWQSLVEDRIEKARLAGQFDNVKGKGKPIVRLIEERNPFIGREEFIMNRIVQRNGAAPPWVEVQIELEAAANAFRENLKQSWTRCAIRMLTATRSTPSLPSIAQSTVLSLRDQEWEERERSYHDTAIAELNSLVRKYNAMAPYAARRLYYARNTELDRAYNGSAEEILRGIRERSRSPPRPEEKCSCVDDDPRRVGTLLSFWSFILQWLRALRRFTKAG